jgi:hypothetical protein
MRKDGERERKNKAARTNGALQTSERRESARKKILSLFFALLVEKTEKHLNCHLLALTADN